MATCRFTSCLDNLGSVVQYKLFECRICGQINNSAAYVKHDQINYISAKCQKIKKICKANLKISKCTTHVTIHVNQFAHPLQTANHANQEDSRQTVAKGELVSAYNHAMQNANHLKENKAIHPEGKGASQPKDANHKNANK